MEHSYFTDRLSAFHDNELKNEERQLIAEHLESCAECQKLLQELERFDAMVEKHSDLADDEYWEKSARKIQAAIGAEEKTEIIEVKRTSYKGLGWKLAGIAASVAIIAFIALYETDIRQQVDKRSKAAVEKTAPAPGSAPDSTRESVADLGGPATEPEEAEDLDVVEGQIQKDESGVVTNEKGEVFIRGGSADEVKYVTKQAPATAEPEAPADEKREELGESEIAPDLPSESMPQLSQIEVYQSVPVMARRDSQDARDLEFDAMMEPPSEMADEEAVLSLEQWRTKRDSVQALLADKKNLGAADGFTTAQIPLASKMEKKRLAEVVDSISRELEKQDPVLLLLESQYKIAQLTDSKEERDEAVSFLRTYLEREDSEYKLQAAFYLQQLDEQ